MLFSVLIRDVPLPLRHSHCLREALSTLGVCVAGLLLLALCCVCGVLLLRAAPSPPREDIALCVL